MNIGKLKRISHDVCETITMLGISLMYKCVCMYVVILVREGLFFCFYQVNNMRFGFSAIGRSAWQVRFIATGQIACKVVIFQSAGTAYTPANNIPISKRTKTKVPLNFENRMGISLKKLVFWTSFAVAPQDISIPSKWHIMACETCREQPPRKMVNMTSQLKFSKRAQKRL